MGGVFTFLFQSPEKLGDIGKSLRLLYIRSQLTEKHSPRVAVVTQKCSLPKRKPEMVFTVLENLVTV